MIRQECDRFDLLWAGEQSHRPGPVVRPRFRDIWSGSCDPQYTALGNI